MAATHNNRPQQQTFNNQNEIVERIDKIKLQAKERQTNLFELDQHNQIVPIGLPLSMESTNTATREKSQRTKLLPSHHMNRDYFLADLFDYAMKDDGASMEVPIFSLSTKPDLSTWTWESKDKSRSVEVFPSVKGRATQFDKDVLIFLVSQMTEAINRGREDTQTRKVRFIVYDYLVSTNKPTGGSQYQRLEAAFDRLVGTTIKTNIKTGGQSEKRIFSLLGEVTIIEKSPNNERMIAVEVTLSKWLFNAIQAHEVLTIHRDYFRLRKPLERRLYELARKHCGKQENWKISLDLLREKCGAHTHIRDFRSQITIIAKSATLPEYQMIYDRDKNQVIFINKDYNKLPISIAQKMAF